MTLCLYINHLARYNSLFNCFFYLLESNTKTNFHFVKNPDFLNSGTNKRLIKLGKRINVFDKVKSKNNLLVIVL